MKVAVKMIKDSRYINCGNRTHIFLSLLRKVTIFFKDSNRIITSSANNCMTV